MLVCTEYGLMHLHQDGVGIHLGIEHACTYRAALGVWLTQDMYSLTLPSDMYFQCGRSFRFILGQIV